MINYVADNDRSLLPVLSDAIELHSPGGADVFSHALPPVEDNNDNGNSNRNAKICVASTTKIIT